MHGLVNRTIQRFLTDTYGEDCWAAIVRAAAIGFCDFEAMLIYDEALGMPEEGIAPGTRFEDIPDDWYCPDCGTEKEDFELLD